MNADEIKALIAQKIAGQGSMIDIGGALPTILNEIVDSITYRIVIPEDTQWISSEDFNNLIKAEKVYDIYGTCFYPSILTEKLQESLRSIAQSRFQDEVHDVVAFFKNGTVFDSDTGEFLSGSVAIIASGKDGVHPETRYCLFVSEI